MREEEKKKRAKAEGRAELDAAAGKLAKLLKVERSRLQGSERTWQRSRVRTQKVCVLARRLGYRPKDVAECFGRDVAAVASLLARLEAKATSAPAGKNSMTGLSRQSIREIPTPAAHLQ